MRASSFAPTLDVQLNLGYSDIWSRREDGVTLVRFRCGSQVAGPVRIAGLLGAIALSGLWCGGIEASSKPDAGGRVLPMSEAGAPNAPNTGSGINVPGTVPPSTGVGPAPAGSATPPPPASSAGGSAQPVVVGSGSACPASATITVGTAISVATAWPATAQTAKGNAPLLLWLLSTYSIDSSNRITGTTKTCQMEMPAVTFSPVGDMAAGVPAGQTGMQQILFDLMSWNGVPTVNVTGVLGGWTVGSSMAVDPIVMLYGLKSTNPLADGSTPWPASPSAFASGDLTYADGAPFVPGVGQPGIVATYKSGGSFYPPRTSLAPNSPTADQAFLVLRTQIQLYGTRTSCTNQVGQAFVTDLNLRIVGCMLMGGQGTCTNDQSDFIDANETQFTPGTGTFKSQQMAAGASCVDVISALP
jgi:hypothetical protein